MRRSSVLVCGAITAALFAFPLAAAASAVVGHSNTVALTNGLVGYWSMDGSSINWTTNTMADLSGQGNAGTLVGMSTTSSPVAGKIGGALKFDGATTYIVASPVTGPLKSEGTYSFWVK